MQTLSFGSTIRRPERGPVASWRRSGGVYGGRGGAPAAPGSHPLGGMLSTGLRGGSTAAPAQYRDRTGTASAASANGADGAVGVWDPALAEQQPAITARASTGLEIEIEISLLWRCRGKDGRLMSA